MLEEHAKIMSILQSAGEVVGRKKLQKMIFIAKKLNFPFYERYDFHFYGPYSEEVTLKVEELSNLGLVREKQEKNKGYYQYRYALTVEGEQFLKNYDVMPPSLDECVTAMNKKNARFLELVSTILYFGHLPKKEINRKISILKEKQHYEEVEIDAAFQFIDSLEAVVNE